MLLYGWGDNQMSLTDKEKEIALQVAHRTAKTYRHKADEPYSFEYGYMIHAFDLFLSRIREEQDKSYVKDVPDHCDRIVWKGRYYNLNNMTPDCAELVEALEESNSLLVKILLGETNLKEIEEQAYDNRNALANHTKRQQLAVFDPNACQCKDENGNPLNQCYECPR